MGTPGVSVVRGAERRSHTLMILGRCSGCDSCSSTLGDVSHLPGPKCPVAPMHSPLCPWDPDFSPPPSSHHPPHTLHPTSPGAVPVRPDDYHHRRCLGHAISAGQVRYPVPYRHHVPRPCVTVHPHRGQDGHTRHTRQEFHLPHFLRGGGVV